MSKPYYIYAFNGSPLAARRPVTEKEILDMMAATSCPEKFEIYELVPVNRVVVPPKTPTYGLERA